MVFGSFLPQTNKKRKNVVEVELSGSAHEPVKMIALTTIKDTKLCTTKHGTNTKQQSTTNQQHQNGRLKTESSLSHCGLKRILLVPNLRSVVIKSQKFRLNSHGGFLTIAKSVSAELIAPPPIPTLLSTR